MRFRMGPFYIPVQLAGLGVSIIVLVSIGTLLFLKYPNDLSAFYFTIVVDIIFLIDIVLRMRHVSFPWISFSEKGVSKDWKFGVHVFISWEECTEIGIIYAQLIDGRHQGKLPWIYFSKVPLTDQQIQAQKKPSMDPKNLIMVEYFPDVLNEVLKYIPKNKIRNLHLIEQQIFS